MALHEVPQYFALALYKLNDFSFSFLLLTEKLVLIMWIFLACKLRMKLGAANYEQASKISLVSFCISASVCCEIFEP